MKMVCKIWLGAVDRDHYGVAHVTIENKKKLICNPQINVSFIFRGQILFKSNNALISYLPCKNLYKF
jgi:hypothetical protein